MKILHHDSPTSSAAETKYAKSRQTGIRIMSLRGSAPSANQGQIFEGFHGIVRPQIGVAHHRPEVTPMLRSAVIVALVTAAALCGVGVGACSEEKAGLGESCGGHAKDPIGCVSDLFCCQPDPRIADIPGTCVEPEERSSAGAACGATSGLCCAPGMWCSVWDQVAGDGTCIADVL
ncbi:MAG: hypothetical protein ABI333_15520 [bacterium]